MSECCREYRCRRKQPIRIQRGFFTWYAVTRWKDRDNGVIESFEKHELEPMICAALEFAFQHKDEVLELYDQREAERGVPDTTEES